MEALLNDDDTAAEVDMAEHGRRRATAAEFSAKIMTLRQQRQRLVHTTATEKSDMIHAPGSTKAPARSSEPDSSPGPTINTSSVEHLQHHHGLFGKLEGLLSSKKVRGGLF